MAFDGQLLALVIVLGVVAMLTLLLRWTFGRDTPRTVPGWPPDPDAPAKQPVDEDFGLLATAATADSHAEAQRIRHLLGIAGIKATTTKDASGQWRVLVFSDQVHRARRVAGGF